MFNSQGIISVAPQQKSDTGSYLGGNHVILVHHCIAWLVHHHLFVCIWKSCSIILHHFWRHVPFWPQDIQTHHRSSCMPDTSLWQSMHTLLATCFLYPTVMWWWHPLWMQLHGLTNYASLVQTMNTHTHTPLNLDLVAKIFVIMI